MEAPQQQARSRCGGEASADAASGGVAGLALNVMVA
jgi:hypothetical protein